MHAQWTCACTHPKDICKTVKGVGPCAGLIPPTVAQTQGTAGLEWVMILFPSPNLIQLKILGRKGRGKRLGESLKIS